MSKGTSEDKSFKARVVYDFEAADDKELTIKEGELVVVTDDSDSNWWKGSNHRGIGIFPSSFVSKDIESRGLTGSTNNSSGKQSSGKKVDDSEKSYLVRALYDFEAAEDNELTFKAGEMIVVTDDSNENWWKGSNERGDGLFPANFVTTELNDENSDKKRISERRRSVQFKEEVNVKIVEKDPEPVRIDEEKIDKLIHLLHEADPSGDEIDSEDLLGLEEQCSLMGPLIDAELEKVDKRISQLNDVNASLVEALNMYRSLMPQENNYGIQYGGYIPSGQVISGQTISGQVISGQTISGQPMQGGPMYGYHPQQHPGHQPMPPSQMQISPSHHHSYQQSGQMPPSSQPQQMYQQPPGIEYQQQPGFNPAIYQQSNQPPLNGIDPRIQQQ